MHRLIPTVFRGFLFGMTLQLAVGPVCVFIFTTGSTSGFLNAMGGIAGVVIVDALFMALALAGVSRLLDRSSLKKQIGVVGAVVVALFGVKLIMDAFQSTPAQTGSLNISITPIRAFLAALALTASNPLTIIFWTSVFGIRINSRNSIGESPIVFSAGCLSATLIFLTSVAMLGVMIHELVPVQYFFVLNVTAGILFIIYSIKKAAELLTNRADSGAGRNGNNAWRT